MCLGLEDLQRHGLLLDELGLGGLHLLAREVIDGEALDDSPLTVGASDGEGVNQTCPADAQRSRDTRNSKKRVDARPERNVLTLGLMPVYRKRPPFPTAAPTISDAVGVAGGVDGHGNVLAGGSAEEPVVQVVRDRLRRSHSDTRPGLAGCNQPKKMGPRKRNTADTWAAERADDSLRAAMIAAPRFCEIQHLTSGIKSRKGREKTEWAREWRPIRALRALRSVPNQRYAR